MPDRMPVSSVTKLDCGAHYGTAPAQKKRRLCRFRGQLGEPGLGAHESVSALRLSSFDPANRDDWIAQHVFTGG